ncbi:hypothetical protein F2P56_020111, partial [Juglans regia]
RTYSDGCRYSIPGIKHRYELKRIRVQSHELLSHTSEEASWLGIQQTDYGHVLKAIFQAVVNGSFEFDFEMLRENSTLMWIKDEKSIFIFSLAVMHRLAKIFSLNLKRDFRLTM